jgi:t-SNARE complex subunit (syntaxin)
LNPLQVGTDIGSELTQQTDKLRKVQQDVDEVELNLKMANKQLRSLARRLATDKIFMIFIALIVIGILFIIIWKIVNPTTSNSGNTDTFQ